MKTLRNIIIAIAMIPGAVSAATFSGEFWDAPSHMHGLGNADAMIASGPATATFQSTGIDYPQGIVGSISDNTTLAAFLGTDAASLSGATTTNLYASVFRFTGFLDLAGGVHRFSVGSDDGFRLTIGDEVIGTAGLRGFNTTHMDYDTGAGGLTAFELIFFENGGSTGVQFSVDGGIAQAAAAPSAVPLPAGLPLLAVALGVFGIVNRRKTA